MFSAGLRRSLKMYFSAHETSSRTVLPSSKAHHHPHSVSAADSITSPTELKAIAVAAATHFQNVLAVELAACNFLRMTRAWLPEDVWLLVWDFLHMDDLVAVSHVCHAWRSLALASPRLWTELEFRHDLHHGGCRCDLCIAARGTKCRRCGTYVQIGSTNMRIVRKLLPCSKPLPLSLTILLPDSDTDVRLSHRPLQKLAAALMARKGRLQKLSGWGLDDAYGISLTDFLRLCPAFPSLTVLDDEANGVWFKRHISLPSLQQVRFYGSPYTKDYDHSSGPLVFPSVAKLDLTFRSFEDLVSSLEAVPNASTLHLHMGYDDPYRRWTPQQQERVRMLLKGIEHIQVKALNPDIDGPLLMALRDSSRREFTLYYCDGHRRTDDFADFHIFADVQGAVELTLLDHSRSYSMEPWAMLTSTLR